MIREFIALAAIAAASLALIGEPATAPAAPTNLAPANPTPNNDAALQAEIERLTAELAAAQSKSEAGPPAAHSLTTTAALTHVSTGGVAGCEGGNCAVPRARSQAASQSRSWQRQRRFGGRDGRPLTIFK